MRSTVKVADLTVGDKLVIIERASMGDVISMHEVTLARITKTIVVLAYETGHEVRYYVRDGMISWLYGRDRYRSPQVVLPTDPMVADARASALLEDLRNTALRMRDKVGPHLRHTEHLDVYIAALTEYRDALKKAKS